MLHFRSCLKVYHIDNWFCYYMALMTCPTGGITSTPQYKSNKDIGVSCVCSGDDTHCVTHQIAQSVYINVQFQVLSLGLGQKCGNDSRCENIK